MTIKIGEPGYTIPPRSEIVVANAVVFEQDGKVVAKVSATYDTKDLPPELHHLFFQVVNSSCNTVVLPHTKDYTEPPPAPKPLPWYKRLFR